MCVFLSCFGRQDLRGEPDMKKTEVKVTVLTFLLLASRALCLCSSSFTVVFTLTPWYTLGLSAKVKTACHSCLLNTLFVADNSRPADSPPNPTHPPASPLSCPSPSRRQLLFPKNKIILISPDNQQFLCDMIMPPEFPPLVHVFAFSFTVLKTHFVNTQST